MKNALRLGIGLVAMGVFSCGGSEEGGAAGSGGSSSGTKLEEVPALMAATYCDAIKSCMGELFELFLAGQDCQTKMLPGIEDADFAAMKAAVDKGTIKYDGTKAQACVDAMKAQGCSIPVKRSPAACQEAMAGTVEAGGECTVNAECKGDAYCKGDSCPGKCTPREAEGVACRFDDACRDGTRCINDKCGTPAGADGPCLDGECDITMICMGADKDKQQPGKCKLISEVFKAKQGETCDFFTTMLLCEADSSCTLETLQPVAFKCGPQVGTGASCKLAVPDACPIGEYCAGVDLQATPPKTEGTCTKAPGDGQACSGAFGGECAPDAVCDDTKVCRVPQRIGGACANDQACHSKNCVAGKCEAGNACTP